MAVVKAENPDATMQRNMRFYVRVQDTPKEAQKPFNNGRFTGTDINPMWRFKKLTEIFGPCGFGWWTQNVRYRFESSPETKEIAVFCELELVVVDPETKEESKPIYGVGGNTYVASRKSGLQASDEAMKMAYTDAISIACKPLGFSHDIYFQADRTKYTAQNENEKPQETKSNVVSISTTTVDDLIKELDIKVGALTKNMTEEQKDELAGKSKDITGYMNYRKCKDANALSKFLSVIKEM